MAEVGVMAVRIGRERWQTEMADRDGRQRWQTEMAQRKMREVGTIAFFLHARRRKIQVHTKLWHNRVYNIFLLSANGNAIQPTNPPSRRAH